MNNYNAIIIDDEPKMRKVLELKLVNHCSDINVIDTAEHITEAYDKIILLKPNIIFLDISMPGGTGFDLLNKFENIEFEIIFVTGYNDFILDALKLSAVDYLLKPVMTEDLILAANRAKERIADRKIIAKYSILKHNINHLGNQDTKIVIAGSQDYKFVRVSEIIRCEGWQKYTRIYLQDGGCIISSYNIGVYKEMLKSYDFITVHKSHLINAKLISKYLKEGVVIMSDNSKVPVSRRRREDFSQRILKGFN